MDAWEKLKSVSVGLSDAWSLITNITVGGGVPGTAINEIAFSLGDPISLTSTISLPTIGTGSLSALPVVATLSVVDISCGFEIEAIPVVEAL